MAIRSITRGGGKAFKAEVTGLKELERKLKALSTDNPALRNDIFGVVGDAADALRDEMRAAAEGAGWGNQSIHFHGPKRSGDMLGEDAINSIFAYAKPRGGDTRKRISALVGVSKRKTMIEWRAGRFPKSPNAKVAPGGAVAESMATMLEFGTSNRPAKPAIRNVIRGQKAKMIEAITAGYNALLVKYSK